MNKSKLPLQSKKFIALIIGVAFTTIFTFLSLIMIAIVPSASSAIVNLITVALASINGCISIYAIGQSAVDWRVNSDHNTKQENKIIDEKKQLIIEAKNFEMQYNDAKNIDWNKLDLDVLDSKNNKNIIIN